VIKASEETTREIIEDYGTDFGFIAMDGVFGDVLAGENVLTKIPLPYGVDLIEDVQLDITSISANYTIFNLFRTRKDKEGRKRAVAMQVEQMKKMNEEKARQERKDEIHDYAKYLDRRG
jgi:hypothetical protein